MDRPEKRVRLMADYCSWGLWDHDGVMIDDEDFPLPEDLRRRIEAWVANYELNCQNYRDPADRTKQFDMVEHSRVGFEIAVALKAYLGAEWIVVYFDEEKIPDMVHVPREVFEYEITADMTAADWKRGE